MSTYSQQDNDLHTRQTSDEVVEGKFDYDLVRRHRSGTVWRTIFMFSTIIGIVVLTALLLNVINQTFGYAAVTNKIDPASLAIDGVPLEELSQAQLVTILEENVSRGLFRKLENDLPMEQWTREDLLSIIMEEVVEPNIEKTWTLWESVFQFEAIRAETAERFPRSYVQFFSWLNSDFPVTPQSSNPLQAGVRTAILGSLWTIAITIIFAFPIGVGAAIYLEEYAGDDWINRVIQTNINNLAGVPSIIYGILGLAIFVRVLEPFTSGTAFGAVEDPTTANGRTIISAGLTLGLLILPLIIINAQEAIKAVPSSLRQASFGLGATKWQTTWSHVLPNAIPGILTGTILAVSRAIGETAPLVVVGASTFITKDPSGPFSKFTTLPIQIFQWTARPQGEFRNIAAAAIIVLLALLLTLNATAVLLRNRYSKQL
jgi:phosphate transport system permease protein